MWGALLLIGAFAGRVGAQTPDRTASVLATDTLRPVTRADAVASALSQGTAVSLARADTSAAAARYAQARALPNPTLSASFTQSAPQLHAIVDLPIDLPAFRGLRSGAAREFVTAARLRLLGTAAVVRYEVETTYGRALAARERARMSARTGRDGDSLVVLARRLRDAGEASDLDIELAMVSAGQLANAAAADSLAAVTALLDLQILMGLDARRVAISLADSLALLFTEAERAIAPRSAVVAAAAAVRVPLRVAAAEATLRAQDLSLRLARRRSALVPSVQLGIEGRDPTGGPPGPFLLAGLALPLPLLNRYRGDIAVAAADRARARTELEASRRESAGAIARAALEIDALRARLERGLTLVVLADRVTAKSLTAYREGASTIQAVLQAQRAARDTYVQFADDVVAAAAAVAALRLALTSS